MTVSARFLLAPLLLALLSSGAHARTYDLVRSSGVLRLATSADYEPFNYLKDNQFTGFEVELGNLLAKQLNLKPVWVKVDFDSLLTNFDKSNYDVVIASHAITSTRAKVVDFTQPHYCGGNLLLTRKGGPLTTKALENKILGAESGSVNLTFLQKLPFKKQIKVYPSTEATYRAVALGEVDAALTDRFGAASAIKTYTKANLMLGEVLWRTASGMAVSKGNSSLKTALNTGLAALLKDGSYHKLSLRYFGDDIRC